MIIDSYNNCIPKKCPECKANWQTGDYNVVAVRLKDCIRLDCRKCGKYFKIDLDEKGNPTPITE
jgi:hypothetical protein